MINRLSNMMCWLVLAMVLVVMGCEQKSKEEMLVYEMLTDPNFVMPDYASRAIEATGGRRAWTKTERIEFDCVVTFYNRDGSFYLTEQHYEIAPWSNSIRISTTEPQGRFVWEFSGVLLKGNVHIGALPIAVNAAEFAEAILNITTAPIRLLDESYEFVRGAEPVKIEGLWYYPIERTNLYNPGVLGEPFWSNVIFYQNTNSSLVDMLWLADVDKEEFLMVRGYDYRELEKGGVLVPAKIELLKTDDGGVLQRRLVEINRHKK